MTVVGRHLMSPCFTVYENLPALIFHRLALNENSRPKQLLFLFRVPVVEGSFYPFPGRYSIVNASARPALFFTVVVWLTTVA